MKKKIITLAGDLASGKGTVSSLLSKDLNYEIYKNGDYVRKLAKEKGLSVTSYNEYLKDHPEIDREIEQSAAKYAENHQNLIVDARLGWYAIPDSFKVYMKVDIDVAAKRAFEDKNRKETESFSTLEEHKQDIMRRYKLENERFFKLYGVRKDDMSNYDLVINTTNIAPEEAKEIIKNEYKKWLEV